MDREISQPERNWNRGRFPTWAKMLVAVAVVLLFSLVFFRVRTFEVSGNVRYSIDEVAEASGITKGDILMAVNKTRTAGRILTKLPYIEQVRIYKEMPGTVRFEVVECSAIVMAESEFSGSWTLSETGKLLEEVDEKNTTGETGYPLIKGITLTMPTSGSQAKFSDVQLGSTAMELARQVQAAGLSGMVSEINVEDPENITLRYGSDLTMELGDGSDGDYKLKYLMAVTSQLEAGRRGVLDLSFSAGEQAVFHPLT